MTPITSTLAVLVETRKSPFQFVPSRGSRLEKRIAWMTGLSPAALLKGAGQALGIASATERFGGTVFGTGEHAFIPNAHSATIQEMRP